MSIDGPRAVGIESGGVELEKGVHPSERLRAEGIHARGSR